MRKMQKWIAACVCGAMLCTSLAGCGGQKLPEQEIRFVTVEDGVIQQAHTDALADVSYELLRQTAAAKEDNLLLSPVSAWLALSMAGQGAAGETADAFAEFSQHIPVEEQKVLAAWLMEYLGQSEADMDMANSVWCDDELTVEEDFISTVQQYYRAEVLAQDLQARNAVKKVNRWIADATDDRIPDMLKEIDEDAVMLLVNALTLDADWQNQFDAGDTFAQTFYMADGTEKKIDFMHQRYGQADYLAWDGGQGMVLPYEDGRLAMIALLPEETSDCNAVLEQLSADWVSELLIQKRQSAMVQLSMPKFEMASSVNLNDVCKAMGLAPAFDGRLADFSNLGTADNGYPVYINRVLQNCTLNVAEEGTEAAAATIVEMVADGAARDPEQLIDLQLNHPFVYLILDMETQIPLFAGVYQGE